MDIKLEHNYFKKLLNMMGKEFVDDLKKELKILNKDATGNLINSLNYKVSEINNEWYIEIISADYLIYVDKGRKPGKRPPIKDIKPWVEARGIKIPKLKGGFITSESAAYIIAKSIGDKGIKPLNFIQRVQTDLFQRYEVKIKIALKQDYEEYIKKIILV